MVPEGWDGLAGSRRDSAFRRRMELRRSTEEREVLGVVEGEALRPRRVLDAEIPAQRLVHVLGVDDGPVRVVAAQGSSGLMRWAKCSPSVSPTARPVQRWYFSMTTKLPMGQWSLPGLRVVEVRAPEVRADDHHHAVGHAVTLGVLPQVVDGVGEVARAATRGRGRGVAWVSNPPSQRSALTATPVLNASTVNCTWRRKVLSKSRSRLPGSCSSSLESRLPERKRVRVRLQAFGGERRAVERSGGARRPATGWRQRGEALQPSPSRYDPSVRPILAR